MEKIEIEYNGKKYPAFEVKYNDVYTDENDADVIVSVVSLWEAMEDAYYCDDEEAIELDNTIFYYCEDSFINRNPSYEELVSYLKKVLNIC